MSGQTNKQNTIEIMPTSEKTRFTTHCSISTAWNDSFSTCNSLNSTQHRN